jgi:hypothetical protein
MVPVRPVEGDGPVAARPANGSVGSIYSGRGRPNPNPPPRSLALPRRRLPTLIPCLASLCRRRSVPPAVDSSVLAGGSAVLVTCVHTLRRIWSPVPGPLCLCRIFLAGDPVTFFLLLLIPLPVLVSPLPCSLRRHVSACSKLHPFP